jgi:hypothetical protein
MTVAFVIALAAPTPALADAAFALSECGANGYIYGFSWNNASRTIARQTALASCIRARGRDCKIMNDDLNLLCFAFAVDKSQECGPYGMAYYESLAHTLQEAIATCRQYGGKDCQVVLAKCDTGEPSAGGNGPIYTPPKFPRCYVGPTHEPRWHPWECP